MSNLLDKGINYKTKQEFWRDITEYINFCLFFFIDNVLIIQYLTQQFRLYQCDKIFSSTTGIAPIIHDTNDTHTSCVLLKYTLTLVLIHPTRWSGKNRYLIKTQVKINAFMFFHPTSTFSCHEIAVS